MNLILPCAPGCCTSGCTPYLEDDFNRADSMNINTGSAIGWVQESGAWEISSNELECTSAGIASCSSLPFTQYAFTSVKATRSSNGNASILLRYSDTSNYTEVRFKIGTSSTVAIISVVAGTPTTLVERSVTMSTGVSYILGACLTGTTVTGYVDGVAYVSEGYLGGLGLALKSDSGTLFDDYTVSEISEDCESCEIVPLACAGCVTGAAPQYLQVVLANFTGTCPGGAACSTVDGTYIVQWQHGAPSSCYYFLLLPSSICGGLLSMNANFSNPSGSWSLGAWLSELTTPTYRNIPAGGDGGVGLAQILIPATGGCGTQFPKTISKPIASYITSTCNSSTTAQITVSEI